MATKPTPTSWTLLLKHEQTTVLLTASKEQRLASIKADLLSALRSRHPEGLLSSGERIPASADEVELATPVDARDLSQGWTAVDQIDDDGESAADDAGPEGEEGGAVGGKGKGKAKASSKGKSNGVPAAKDTPAGLGLRDGSAVAFRFAGQEEWVVRVPVFDDEEEEEPLEPMDGIS